MAACPGRRRGRVLRCVVPSPLLPSPHYTRHSNLSRAGKRPLRAALDRLKPRRVAGRCPGEGKLHTKEKQKMKRISLTEIVMEELDVECLVEEIRNLIREEIDYSDIAAEIVGDLDITSIVRDNIEELPF